MLTSHDVSGILNSKVQNDNGSTFKAAVTQGVSKVLGIEYHWPCSWRPQTPEKVEKANDTLKRHLHKLTQETQDTWLKVLPLAWRRARTALKKEGLSPFECIYGRPFLGTDIVIDPEALELTMWVSFQPFKRHYRNSGRWLLTQPLSQTSRCLIRNWDGPENLGGPAFIFTSNHVWCLSLIWWYLAILKWTGATLCTLTMDMM